MKKIIFMAILILSTFICNAKTITMKSTRFKLNETSWVPSNIKITWNTDTKRIMVYTVTKQIIDYVTLSTLEDDTISVIYGKGTDSEYKVMNFYFILKNDQLYLSIEYSDLVYTYKVDIIEE